ncbi:hypothetical protein CEUSTIGMA_g11673.t1 [Chlamydomonas eustigma]|uniref:Uncharacterized protein n=1 Tax=Chlamydomonas eustigma TaxID=1157962 RepID=A0A250XN60_9CHLO|nr:hypothetical protein CEUSTIGMA_g11673.t1 [Chlamydomonas eustigma]|eukprot:GAX84250.1 hypothetical protein CEUSTIGMA_g11673.t1 [Chlamydomonas eustigma]
MRQRTVITTRVIEDVGPSNRRSLFEIVDQTLSQAGPLDTDEQERVIQEFEDIQLRNSRTWRICFGAVALLFSLLYFHAAISQQAHPWELRYIGEFQSVTHHTPAIAVLLLQATALGAAAFTMLSHIPRKHDRERGCLPVTSQQRLTLWAAVMMAASAAVFWSWKLYQMRLKYGKAGGRWELVWVPLLPLIWIASCLYVCASLQSTANEVSRLKTYQYQHKKV